MMLAYWIQERLSTLKRVALSSNSINVNWRLDSAIFRYHNPHVAFHFQEFQKYADTGTDDGVLPHDDNIDC